MQDIERLKTIWDDEIPENLRQRWLHWCMELQRLADLKVNRCISLHVRVQQYQIHHVSDASEIVDVDGRVLCTLLVTKSRLVPTRTLTIPRFELTAPALSVKLDKAAQRARPIVKRHRLLDRQHGSHKLHQE